MQRIRGRIILFPMLESLSIDSNPSKLVRTSVAYRQCQDGQELCGIYFCRSEKKEKFWKTGGQALLVNKMLQKATT